MSVDLVRAFPEQRRCALYRHYDADDVLLYAGISETPVDRTNAHARTSEWVQFADRAEAQWFASRRLAEDAEREAIEDESPIFNRQYAVGDVDRRIAEYLRDRELRQLRRVLKTYESIVKNFLAVVPASLAAQAAEATRRDYDCAGIAEDHDFPLFVLRHIGKAFSTYLDDIVGIGALQALESIQEEVGRRIAAAKPVFGGQTSEPDPF